MNQNTDKKKIAFQQQESPLQLKLNEKFGQNIFYISPNRYSNEMKQFNKRNSTYGVTIDYRFLRTIQECAFLESSQLQFYMNLFRKTYSNIKLVAATCYFFNDLIVSPSQVQQQSQIIKLDWKRPNVEVKSQEQNKIEDPPNHQKELLSKQIDQQQPEQNNLENQKLSINNNDNSKIEQKKQLENTKINEQQQPNSKEIQKNSSSKESQQQQQQQQQQNTQQQKKQQQQNTQQKQQQKQQYQQQQIKQKDVKNMNNDSKANQNQVKQQTQQQNQIQQKTNSSQQQTSKQDSIQQKSGTNSNTNSINQNYIKENEDKNKNYKEFINQVPVNQNIVQHQIDKNQIEQNAQQPIEQEPVKQIQVETQIQQIQPPPEKKFHFQITNIKVEQPPPQEIADKLKLGLLIKQLAEINNLTEQDLNVQDYWFFPINLLQAHWISIVVQFNPKQIYYFDSDSQKIDPLIIQGIHSILKYQNFDPKDFQTKQILNKQDNGYDCGIFLLLSLLYTLKQQKYDYNQKIVNKFRFEILYNLAVIGAQADINQDFFEFIMNQC